MRPVDKKQGLTLERLKSLLAYDPVTGVFIWLVWRPNGIKVGDAAGTVDSNGYLKIKLDGHKYQASRLAWFYMTGEWPRDMLDHADMDKLNNKWSNLREATRSQNGANRSSCGATGGLKGAHYNRNRKSPKKWAATIRVDGRNKTLGYFMTPEEAHAAYIAAAEISFGEFARRA